MLIENIESKEHLVNSIEYEKLTFSIKNKNPFNVKKFEKSLNEFKNVIS